MDIAYLQKIYVHFSLSDEKSDFYTKVKSAYCPFSEVPYSLYTVQKHCMAFWI